MTLKTRCLPVGTLAYGDIDSAVRMSAKLFEKMPFLAELPKVFPQDTILKRTLENIPGIIIENKKVIIKTGSNEYKQALTELEKAYNTPVKELLEPYQISSEYFEKFCYLLHRFKAPNACINLLGPFTISQMLMNAAEEQMIADRSFRKLFIQAVCVKALWAIEKIKEQSPNTTPIIILEEPVLAQLGNLKRENEDITAELVTNMIAKVVEKLKPTGAIIGVQCLEKCDWKIPINAGIDLISFDAYNNPNNLCIIPDYINEFLEKNGRINWGIVPTINEALIKNTTIDSIQRRLIKTFEGLVAAGVPRHLVYNSSLVSIQGDSDKLSLIFSEKAIILATQLAKRIPVIKNNEQAKDKEV